MLSRTYSHLRAFWHRARLRGLAGKNPAFDSAALFVTLIGFLTFSYLDIGRMHSLGGGNG